MPRNNHPGNKNVRHDRAHQQRAALIRWSDRSGLDAKLIVQEKHEAMHQERMFTVRRKIKNKLVDVQVQMTPVQFAVWTLWEGMQGRANDTQIRAANTLLAYAWGKPPMSIMLDKSAESLDMVAKITEIELSIVRSYEQTLIDLPRVLPHADQLPPSPGEHQNGTQNGVHHP